MKSKIFLLIAAFVLSISSFGFICDEDEDSAQARIDNWTNCIIQSASYGNTSWGYIAAYGESGYKDISGSNRITIYAANGSGGYATYYSSYQDAPEEGKKYTMKLYGSCGSYTYTVSED